MKHLIFAVLFFAAASSGFASDFSNNRLYLGLRAGFSSNSELFDEKMDASVSFTTSGSAFLKFTSFFGLQAEVGYIRDSINGGIIEYEDYTYESNYLVIPLLMRFSFTPGVVSIGPFAGFFLNIPLGDVHETASVAGQTSSRDLRYNRGWNHEIGTILGLNVGVILGPGSLFFDIRFMGGPSIMVKDNGRNEDLWTPARLPITLGYEIGLGRRN
jgi:hypothetical protein